MANICDNQYRFVFGNEEKAKRFLDFINKDASVYELGVAAKIDGAEKRDVRESIYYAEIDKNTVNVYTESKWTPCPNAWRDIARTFDDGVEAFYEAEEPGCVIFASNDPRFVGKYVYDFWNVPEGLKACHCDETGIADKEGLIKVLQAALGTKTQDLEDLLLLMIEKGFADDFSVHEIEYRPIEDWDE